MVTSIAARAEKAGSQTRRILKRLPSRSAMSSLRGRSCGAMRLRGGGFSVRMEVEIVLMRDVTSRDLESKVVISWLKVPNQDSEHSGSATVRAFWKESMTNTIISEQRSILALVSKPDVWRKEETLTLVHAESTRRRYLAGTSLQM